MMDEVTGELSLTGDVGLCAAIQKSSYSGMFGGV